MNPPKMRNVARQASLSDSSTAPANLAGVLASGSTNGASVIVRTPQNTQTSAGIPPGTSATLRSTTSPITTTPTINTTPTVITRPTTTTITSSTVITDAASLTTNTTTPNSTPTSSSNLTSTTSPSTTPSSSTTSTTQHPTSTTTSSSSTNSNPSSSSSPSSTFQSSSSSTSLTTSFTTITTAVNGQLITLTSPLPTSLSTSLPSGTTHNRTAIIAGGTTAAAILILILLGCIFLHRKRKLRERQALSSIHDRTREGPREGRGLLSGEDFDDDDSHPIQMRSYRDSELTMATTTRSSGTMSFQPPSPSIHRPRASETGSIFREEEVWPPPSEFVDRFLQSVRRNQEIDLGRIVDDVMGPSERYSAGHTPTSSLSSRNEVDHWPGDGTHRTHRKSDSDTSNTGLLDGSRDRPSQGSSSSYADPYSPSRYATAGQGKSTTAHNPFSPGASSPIPDSGHDPMVIAPGAYSLQPPPRMLQNIAVGTSSLIASKPKKPSPLARAMSTASITMGNKTRLWLERKVRKEPTEGGGRSGGADVDAIGLAY